MRLQHVILGAWGAIGLVAAIVSSAPASAQTYPSRVIKVIAPFPPGGPVDLLARALSEGFKERTGQTFVVENKPGGNTIIAANACKGAEPDGYTFCILTASTI